MTPAPIGVPPFDGRAEPEDPPSRPWPLRAGKYRWRTVTPLHCFWLVEGPPPEILEFFAAARKKFWSKACTHACAAAGEVAFKIKVRALA